MVGKRSCEGEERDRFGIRGVPLDVRKVYTHGRGGGGGRRRDDVRHRARRARGGGGALGRGQDDAPEHAGRDGRVLVGHHHAGRSARSARSPSKELTYYRRYDIGLRVPVLQPRAEPHGAWRTWSWRARSARTRSMRHEVLAQVGLGRSPGQLPGAAFRRRAAARGHRPRAGEEPEAACCATSPTGALDYRTGKAILRLLQDTCFDTGKTVVLITHNSGVHGERRPGDPHPRGARGGRPEVNEAPAVGRRRWSGRGAGREGRVQH